MRYTPISGTGQFPYPDHNIDPALKDSLWCMQYAKAAYYDWNFASPKGIFSANGGDYEKYRLYALGKQPINQYKKWMGVDQQTNNTQLVVDWSVRSVVSGYRDKAISRLMKNDYTIVATAVDSLAKDEMDDYYAAIKAKLAMRDLMIQQNPEMANHPALQLNAGEPRDIEELEMRVSQNEQFNRSKDAEMAIELGMYENDYKAQRRMIYEDLFDFGVAGFADWLGDDNKAKFRRVNPNCVIVSNTKDGTFSDIVHAGEQIDISLIELATVKDKEGNLVFTEKELIEFAGTIAGKNFSNPGSLGLNTGWLKPIDKFKCKVVDIKFYTYNTDTYTNRVDANGNLVFRKEKYGRGEENNIRYVRKRIQYVYKCKWIVGTEKCYDWGMCYDQPRSNNPQKKALTRLPYTFFAYNFYNMKAQGFMERMIPYLDDYQLTMLRIQNWKNRFIPGGWWINLDMLENVALTKGGADMTPKELLQMLLETGILVGRSLDGAGNPLPGNVQPIIAMDNTSASELQVFYQDLLNTIMAIEKMTGYNMITSGNPNPKTLTSGYEVANQSTDDALYPIAFAEEFLSLRLAEAVLCRMKQGLKKGTVEGYAPYQGALNANTLRFLTVSPDIAEREHGIMLQQKSSENDRIWLLNQINQDIANGFLDTSDAILIINTHNVKEAMQILAFRVKKAKQALQEQKMAELQSTNQANMQIAQMAQQEKFQFLQMELQAKMQINKDTLIAEIEKEKMKIQADLQIRKYEMDVKYGMNERMASSKEISAEITANAKVAASHVQGADSHVKSILDGQAAIKKQEVANMKAASTTTK
jgi:hypothetical protein